jgi:hypothetical protein
MCFHRSTRLALAIRTDYIGGMAVSRRSRQRRNDATGTKNLSDMMARTKMRLGILDCIAVIEIADA